MVRVHLRSGLAALLFTIGLAWSLPAQATPFTLPAIWGTSPGGGGDHPACSAAWVTEASPPQRAIGCGANVDRGPRLSLIWADNAFKTTNAIFWEKPHLRVTPLAIAELPEPVLLVLLGVGLVVVAMLRRRAKR